MESEEVEIPGGAFGRRLARRVDIGPRPRQGLQIAVAPEQEDARAPIEIARRRVSFRRGQIRLFDEAFDTEAGTGSKRPATANMAVPGFGPSGSNAEGDEMAGLCAAGAFGNGTPESRTILDVMVGRHDEQDRTGLDPCEMKGRDRRRWRGVPAHRLQEKRAVSAPASWSCAAAMKRLSCEVTITGRRNPSRGGTGRRWPAAGSVRRRAAETASAKLRATAARAASRCRRTVSSEKSATCRPRPHPHPFPRAMFAPDTTLTPKYVDRCLRAGLARPEAARGGFRPFSSVLPR